MMKSSLPPNPKPGNSFYTQIGVESKGVAPRGTRGDSNSYL